MPDIISAVGQPSAIASVPAPQAGVQSSGPIQGLVLTMPQTQPQTSQSSVRDMSTPAGQLTSMAAPFRASAPLSEGVSPFTSKSQSAPAVEYVPFTEPLPVELKPDMYASVRNSDAPATPANQKPPVAPAVQQIPVTTAPQQPRQETASQPVPQSVSAGSAQTSSQTTPMDARQLMQKIHIPQAGVIPSRPVEYSPRPTYAPPVKPVTVVPYPAPAAAVVKPASQQAAPMPAAPLNPARNLVQQTPPVVPATPEPPKPKPVQQTVTGRMEIKPVQKPAAAQQPTPPATTEPISQSAPQPVVASPPESSRKPIVLYSVNTRAIWQVRRMQKAFSTMVIVTLILLVTAVIGYWVSIGAPTHLRDLPFISSN